MGLPTYTPLVENRREGGFVVWDPSDGMFTREAGLIQSGAGIVTSGLVLAAILTGGAATVATLGSNTGNGAMGAVTVGAAAKVGDYKVVLVEPNANAGAFVLEDPSGMIIGHGNVAAAFTGGGLSFTLADGATDFVSGDTLVITVTGATKYVAYDPTSVTGAQYAAALLWSGYRDATSADKRAVLVVRGPIKINPNELVWGAGVTTDSHKTTAFAQLAKNGIRSI